MARWPRADAVRDARPGVGAADPANAANAANAADSTPDGTRAGWCRGLSALLLLAALAAGLLGQGAYYASMQRYVAALIAAALALALATRPPTRADARVLPVLAAAALAAWAVLDAAWHEVPAASLGVALLLLGAVAVLVVCGRLGQEDRELLLVGVIWIGLAVALVGWFGVAARVGSWALEGQGIWRASSTLSYPNATAAMLAPVAVLALARLTERQPT
jgi:hypothetical protein